MQQIERYGVIALVFLLVTIVAVSFWGDNKSPSFWSRLMGRGDAKKTAVIEDPATSSMLPPPAATERALQDPLPLSSAPTAPAAETAQPLNAAPSIDPVATLAAPPQSSSTFASNGAPASSSIEPVVYADPISSLAEEQVAAPAPVIAKQSAQKSSATATSSTYVVQKGDSLARIARAKLGSEQRWTEIQALNGGVDPKGLRVGMKLKLPSDAKSEASAPKSKSSTPAKSPAKASKQSGATYVVKGGDSLTRIAQRMLGDGNRWKEIVAMNPGVDPDRLAVGTALKLPAGESRPMVAAALPTNRQEKPRVR